MNRIPNYNPAEHTIKPQDMFLTRRQMLQRSGMGMGALSLAVLLGEGVLGRNSAAAAALSHSPLMPKQPMFPVKAKHVIHIFAGGGPSHVDTWDPKPVLAKFAEQTLPGLSGLAMPSPF